MHKLGICWDRRFTATEVFVFYILVQIPTNAFIINLIFTVKICQKNQLQIFSYIFSAIIVLHTDRKIFPTTLCLSCVWICVLFFSRVACDCASYSTQYLYSFRILYLNRMYYSFIISDFSMTLFRFTAFKILP